MSGPITVLLVEDNPGDARLVSEALGTNDLDFAVDHVERLDDALAYLAATTPDAIILDLNLPDSEGLDTFRTLHGAYRDVPVVVLSVLADEEAAFSTVRLGAQDYLYKSELTGRALPRTVRYAIDRQELRSELQALAADLQQLIAHAAHDLGHPVAAVSGLADVLDADRRAIEPEAFDELVGVLRRQSRRLGDLVADLMDIARLHQDVELVDVPVHAMVKEALASLPPPSHLEVTTPIPDDVAVRATDAGLERLLTNLLSNAYRHADHQVEVSTEPVGEDLAIVVADDGDGVPDEFLDQLFDDFARGPNVTDGSGTGLGLSIVRRLARTFGGDASYRATGEGARFRVVLPRGTST